MSGCDEEHCITCGDIAVEMAVVGIDVDGALALCTTDAGDTETVDVTLVAPIRISERLLIHAGTAIARPGGAL